MTGSSHLIKIFPLVSASILLFSIVALLFLSSASVLLSVVLVLLALIKHFLSPIKKEFVWYALVCFGGALVEIALVNYAEAWNYSTTHFFNIPIWMPLFWGNVAITLIELYDWLKRL